MKPLLVIVFSRRHLFLRIHLRGISSGFLEWGFVKYFTIVSVLPTADGYQHAPPHPLLHPLFGEAAGLLVKEAINCFG